MNVTGEERVAERKQLGRDGKRESLSRARARIGSKKIKRVI